MLRIVADRKPISSLPEAQAELEHLKALGAQVAALSSQVSESVEALSQFFGVNPAPTAKAKRPQRAVQSKVQASLLGEAATVAANVVTTPPGRTGHRAPATMIERVLVIIRDLQKDLGRPVMPKDIEREYLLRSWPSPKNGTPYNLISGTVGYLYNQKKLLTKNEQGYSLPNPDVQVLLPTRKRTRKPATDQESQSNQQSLL